MSERIFTIKQTLLLTISGAWFGAGLAIGARAAFAGESPIVGTGLLAVAWLLVKAVKRC